MFETSRRQHPLHTFRFWFVVLTAAFVTLAWKFDLLPVRIGPADTGRLAQETFTEVEPFDDLAPTSADPASSSSAGAKVTSADLLSEPDPGRTSAAPLRQTAAIEPDLDLAPQAEPQPSEPAPASVLSAGTAGSPPADPFADDEWSTEPAARPPAAPPSATVADQPHADSAIVLAAATTTSFEADAATNSAAPQPFKTADVRPLAPTEATGIDFTEIDRLLATGLAADEIEAHRMLSTIYWKQPEARGLLRDRIDPLAQQIYFLGSRHYMDAYQVQPGDMLQKIAGQYDVTWEYLAKLNRVDPRKVRAGQRLKVIKGPFSAIVDLSDYEITIHAYGYYVTRYPVGIGKDGSSPIGKFTVQEKLIDPTYFGPNGVIEHDDPANPLGERWIDIGNSYGLHGTIDPTSIGKSESQGCIRLHNDDIAAVYDLLTIGSEVVIRP